MIETCSVMLLAGILIPIVTYFSVKLGAYGYLRAKFLFDRDHQKGKTNGDKAS